MIVKTDSSQTDPDSNGKPNAKLSSEKRKDMIIEALEDSKALDIKVLDIAQISSFADFMIVASGTSSTHLKSIAGNIKRELSRKGLSTIGAEGEDSHEWVLVDFSDIVVHVMRPEVREFYDLEQLWDKEVRQVLNDHQSE